MMCSRLVLRRSYSIVACGNVLQERTGRQTMPNGDGLSVVLVVVIVLVPWVHDFDDVS